MMKWKILALVGCIFGVAGTGFGIAAQSSQPQVFELRMYKAREGKRDALSQRFREHTMGMFEKAGMTNVGYWTGLAGEDAESEDTFVYMLAYPSREARDEMWRVLGEDTDFQREIIAEERSEDLRLVDEIETRFLVPTDYSPLR
jgi:hypothetical protein